MTIPEEITYFDDFMRAHVSEEIWWEETVNMAKTLSRLISQDPYVSLEIRLLVVFLAKSA